MPVAGLRTVAPLLTLAQRKHPASMLEETSLSQESQAVPSPIGARASLDDHKSSKHEPDHLRMSSTCRTTPATDLSVTETRWSSMCPRSCRRSWLLSSLIITIVIGGLFIFLSTTEKP